MKRLPRTPQEASSQSEAQIQVQIVAFLEREGFLVLQYAVPGGHRELRGAVPVGHPDLLAIGHHRDDYDRETDCRCMLDHIWFEVKADKGRLKLAQSEIHTLLRKAGDPVYVVRSVEDVMDALKAEGFETRHGDTKKF